MRRLPHAALVDSKPRAIVEPGDVFLRFDGPSGTTTPADSGLSHPLFPHISRN